MWICFFSLIATAAIITWHLLHVFSPLKSKCFSSSMMCIIPVFQMRKPKLRMFKQIFHTLKTKMFPSMEQNSQSCTFPKPCFFQFILIFNSEQCNTVLIQLVTNLKMSNQDARFLKVGWILHTFYYWCFNYFYLFFLRPLNCTAKTSVDGYMQIKNIVAFLAAFIISVFSSIEWLHLLVFSLI